MTTNLHKQIKMFKDQVGACQKAYADLSKKLEEERGLRYNAEKEAKETRKQFADLKERLHRAEMLNARNEGYLERVREDDNVADPLVAVEDANGKRMVSKRFPTVMINVHHTHDEYMNIINAEKTKHWVTY